MAASSSNLNRTHSGSNALHIQIVQHPGWFTIKHIGEHNLKDVVKRAFKEKGVKVAFSAWNINHNVHSYVEGKMRDKINAKDVPTDGVERKDWEWQTAEEIAADVQQSDLFFADIKNNFSIAVAALTAHVKKHERFIPFTIKVYDAVNTINNHIHTINGVASDRLAQVVTLFNQVTHSEEKGHGVVDIEASEVIYTIITGGGHYEEAKAYIKHLNEWYTYDYHKRLSEKDDFHLSFLTATKPHERRFNVEDFERIHNVQRSFYDVDASDHCFRELMINNIVIAGSFHGKRDDFYETVFFHIWCGWNGVASVDKREVIPSIKSFLEKEECFCILLLRMCSASSLLIGVEFFDERFSDFHRRFRRNELSNTYKCSMQIESSTHFMVDLSKTFEISNKDPLSSEVVHLANLELKFHYEFDSQHQGDTILSKVTPGIIFEKHIGHAHKKEIVDSLMKSHSRPH
jgi:hypothetical protein